MPHSHTGVAGLTLGGGIGWLSRSCGLTIDSLVEVEFVDAAGNILTVSQSSNAELFWGLRGAGAGLGIVTTFTFKLHSISPVQVLEARFPFNRGYDILRKYAALCASSPRQFVAYCFASREGITLLAAVISTDAAATAAAEKKTDVEGATSNLCVTELLAEIESWCPSYCARRTDTLLSLNSAFDNGNRHGRHYRWSRSTFLTAFGEPAIKSIMKSICESDDAGLENFNVQISQLGGCMGDVSSDATAFHHRSAAYEVHAIVVSDTEISRKAAQSVARFSSAMATHGSGGYVNISSEPSLAWFEQAYGGASKMKRILNLKASCDPENFFGHNALGAAFSISNSGNVGNQNSQWGQADMQFLDRGMGAVMDSSPTTASNTFVTTAWESSQLFLASLKAAIPRLKTVPSSSLAPPQDEGAQYWCDICMQPFEGASLLKQTKKLWQKKREKTRYHCAECSSFDMCEACFFSTDHPHHLWKEVPKGERIRLGAETSVGELVLAAMSNYRNRWCLGTWDSQVGSRRWHTFGDILLRVQSLSCGLRSARGSLSLPPRSRVGICGGNSEDWVVCDLAALATNLVSVPIDSAATSEELVAIINQAELTVVICSDTVASQMLLQVAGRCPVLRTIIVGCFDEKGNGGSDTRRPKQGAVPHDVQMHCLSVIEAAGRKIISTNPSAFNDLASKPHSNDIVTVMYSSGSTGSAKGALLSDASLLGRLRGQLLPSDPSVIVSYMPLSHSFDRLNLLVHFVLGGRCAFHHGPVSCIFETLQEVRPSTFSSTPRLWNILYQEHQDLVRKEGLTVPAASARITAMLGDRVATIGTGGAKTSPEVLQFMRSCFRCAVGDGFGATETGGIAWDGSIGDKVRTKLIDAPPGYLRSDLPYPRGELCVHTDTMATGYLGDKAATAEAFFTDDDGVRWYKTGDIVEMQSTFKVVVVDRKKSVFKLSQGEFVAPQKLEHIFETSPLISQCFVTAMIDKDFPVAVVVVDCTLAAQHAEDSDGDMSIACLPGSPLGHEVLAAIKDAGTRAGIRPFEFPQGVILTHRPWDVKSGLLTGTLKLRRPLLEVAYKADIINLYERLQCTTTSASILGRSVASAVTSGGESGEPSTAARLMEVVKHIIGVDGDKGAAVDVVSAPLSTFVSDSLSYMRLTTAINREFKTSLSVVVLLEAGATLASIATFLEGRKGHDSTTSGGLNFATNRIDFPAQVSNMEESLFLSTGAAAAACPASEIGVGPNAPASEIGDYHTVVLSGTTGFVGIFLLVEVLRQLSRAKVVCLVRSDTIELGHCVHNHAL
jgi:long-subunit acyl-CoA synthetase (AMP-forming)